MKHKIIAYSQKALDILKFWRNGKSNLNMLLTFVALVMIWRGIWHLLDQYLLPNHYFLNATIPLIVWLIFLYFDDESLKELTK